MPACQSSRIRRWQDLRELRLRSFLASCSGCSAPMRRSFRTPAADSAIRPTVAPAGYSTLERHEHAHAVMILRGAGQVLVGDEVFPVNTFDLVTVPPLTWHQFRAASESPLGFLCMVDAERDKSQLPSARDLEG